MTIIYADVDDCLSNPCQNSGICNDAVGLYSCNCINGYNGTHCETGKQACSFSDIHELEIRKTVKKTTTPMLTIICALLDVDECVSNPCQNSGSCNDGVGLYFCNCTNGYNGTHCEIGRL